MAVAKKAPAAAVAAPTSTPFTQQVISQVSDPNTRLAMLTGAALEGGTYGAGNTIGVGDAGHSYGYFQINLPFHPGMTPASATDPAQSVAYMKAAYSAAAAKVPASLWQSNPEKAAETAAFYAERPAKDYYVARGQAAVDRAFNMAQGALGGPGASPSPAPAPKGDAAPQGSVGSGKIPAGGITGQAQPPTPAPQTPKAGKKSDGGPMYDLGAALGNAVHTGDAIVAGVTTAATAPQTFAKISDTIFSVSFWTRAAFILVGLGLVFIGTRALLTGDDVQIGPDAEYGTAAGGQADKGGGASSEGATSKGGAASGTAKKGFGKTAAADAGEAAEVA